MHDLIQVNYDSDRPTVLGRDLHKLLEVESKYTTWFRRMCEYGFSESTDFIPFLEESTGGRPTQDHQLTIEMAKEICMLQRNEKGKQVRQYFINLEKAWNTPEMIMNRALKLAERQIKELSLQVEQDKPKVIFAEAVAGSKTSLLIGDFAKILKQNGIDTGEKRLYQWFRENGYIMKRGNRNLPTQQAMNAGWFEIKRSLFYRSNGYLDYSPKAMVTGKGQVYFINKFIQNKKAADMLASHKDNACDDPAASPALTISLSNWKKDVDNVIHRIANEQEGLNTLPGEIRRQSYEQLDKRHGIGVKGLLSRRRQRMEEEGADLAERMAVTILDIIGEHKSLLEGYLEILMEMAEDAGVSVTIV